MGALDQMTAKMAPTSNCKTLPCIDQEVVRRLPASDRSASSTGALETDQRQERGDMLSSWLSRRRFRRRLETISGHGNRIIWLVPLFVPVLLLVSFVESNAPSSAGSHVNSIVWGIAAVFVVCVCIFYWIERYRAVAFLQWLHEQRDALRMGRIEHSGQAISRSTEVIQYRLCISIIVLTVEFDTAFVPMRDGHWRSAVVPTLVTCLLGWWGIPFGPFYTIAAVIHNIRGGQRRSVQELLNEMAADADLPKPQ
jgi:hypothetical protein